MPVLKDQRHELFAQQMAAGATEAKAAHVAGYSEKSARTTGWRLKQNAAIVARIAELCNVITERAIEKAAVDKAAVLTELAKLGFANMQDYMIVGEDGVPALNWKDLTRDQAAALQEVTVDENKIGDVPAGKKIKFKLADKKSSLELIGKELGMFGDKSKERPATPLDALTDEQLIGVIAAIAERLTPEELAALGLTGAAATKEPEPPGRISPLH